MTQFSGNQQQGDDGFIIDDDHLSGVLFDGNQSDEPIEEHDYDLESSGDDDLSFDDLDPTDDELSDEDIEDFSDEDFNFDELEGEDEEGDFDDLDDPFDFPEDDFIDEEEGGDEYEEGFGGTDAFYDELNEITTDEPSNGESSDEGHLNEEVKLIIPDEVKQQFSEYVDLIQRSESMNSEERQYWVDALSTMTEDQLANLKKILTSEQEQLKAANAAYQEGGKEAVRQFDIDFDESKYREKKRVIREVEAKHEAQEEQDEAALLEEIENMEI